MGTGTEAGHKARQSEAASLPIHTCPSPEGLNGPTPPRLGQAPLCSTPPLKKQESRTKPPKTVPAAERRLSGLGLAVEVEVTWGWGKGTERSYVAVGVGVPVLREAWWVEDVRGLLRGIEELCPLCASAQAKPVATGILDICSPDELLHILAGLRGRVLAKPG